MCGCAGGNIVAKSMGEFSITPSVVDGWYIIDLCNDYKIKYKNNNYYLVNGQDIYSSTKDNLKKWALDNCGMDI
jgi:hypothetical protein